MSVHCHEMGLPDQDSINFSVCLSLCRMCSTPFATTVVLFRGLLSSGRTVFKPWSNILLIICSFHWPCSCTFKHTTIVYLHINRAHLNLLLPHLIQSKVLRGPKPLWMGQTSTLAAARSRSNTPRCVMLTKYCWLQYHISKKNLLRFSVAYLFAANTP